MTAPRRTDTHKGNSGTVQDQSNESQQTESRQGVRTGDFAGHRVTVVAAETRRLRRELLALGPMRRDRLAERCRADRWREGTFEEAVQQGVKTGQLRRLPLGWIAASAWPDDRRPDTSA